MRTTVRQDRRVIRVGAGVGLALLTLWGVAGAITPDASLGGVSLARYGAGGQVGGWLDSPIGWGVILLGLVTSIVLIAPSAARSLIRAAGRSMQDGMRYLGRETKARGPGVLAANRSLDWTRNSGAVAQPVDTDEVVRARTMVGVCRGRYPAERNQAQPASPGAASSCACPDSSSAATCSSRHAQPTGGCMAADGGSRCWFGASISST